MKKKKPSPQDVPMGVSEWREHGKKYGYWGYFYDEAYTAGRRDGAAAYITWGYGKRCKTKDTDDFPEMKDDPKHGRCACCEEWEHYDEWVEKDTAALSPPDQPRQAKATDASSEPESKLEGSQDD